jgi:hypothetical protein
VLLHSVKVKNTATRFDVTRSTTAALPTGASSTGEWEPLTFVVLWSMLEERGVAVGVSLDFS